MRKPLILIAALALFTLAITAVAQAGPVLDRIKDKGEVVVGTAPDNPPLSLTSRDDKLMGYDIDLAALVAAGLGVRLRLVPMSFPELLPALREGKVDMLISGLSMTPQRNLGCMFSGPYLISGQAILAHTEVAKRFQGPDDLNKEGVIIAAALESTSLSTVREMMPKAKVLEVDSQETGLRAVLEGKAHVLVADYAFCALAALRYADQGLASLDRPFTFEPLGIAFMEDALLANWMDNFLLLLKGTGRMEYLSQRWFKDSSWMKEMKTDQLL